MLMGLVLAVAALLACPAEAAAPTEARARSLKVRNALCPYMVHKIDRKMIGLRKKPVRWLDVRCLRPSELVRVGDLEFNCTQLTYEARVGKRKFKVGAGCVARLISVGLPAQEVRVPFEN